MAITMISNASTKASITFAITPTLTRDYITLFLEEGTWQYIFETPSEKRLESLPRLLRSFHWFSDEYRSFEKKVRAEAKKQKCAPQSLSRNRDWPDFKW